jgi:hypothetical protein
MALSDYLQPVNAGKQMWQVLKGNMTRGDHPWNFVGICQALVSQWFVELRFANGRQPEELGRYLVQADFGAAGYNSIFKVQANNLTLDTQSGGTVNRLTGYIHATPVDSGATLGMVLLSRLRGVDERNVQGLQDIKNQIVANHRNAPTVFSCQLSITGTHSWLTSKVFGDTWGHAIGIHCNGDQLYVFDPNAGVYIIDPRVDENVNGFSNDLWSNYEPTIGSLEPIAPLL